MLTAKTWSFSESACGVQLSIYELQKKKNVSFFHNSWRLIDPPSSHLLPPLAPLGRNSREKTQLCAQIFAYSKKKTLSYFGCAQGTCARCSSQLVFAMVLPNHCVFNFSTRLNSFLTSEFLQTHLCWPACKALAFFIK